MKGFWPTVSLGTPRAPSVPCSARAVAMAVLGLGDMVICVGASTPPAVAAGD